MKADEILITAAALVSGARNETHGPKLQNHQNIGDLWNAYLGSQLAYQITPAQVARMMALLKIARTKIGCRNVDDDIDGAAYLACAAEIEDEPPGAVMAFVPVNWPVDD